MAKRKKTTRRSSARKKTSRSKTSPPGPDGNWPPVFLSMLAASGNVAEAARLAGVDRTTPYAKRTEDHVFADQWKEAIEVANDALELEARRRAVQGTEKPVFYRGRVIAKIREYSDTLLIFLLKAHRPEKFRENVKVEMPALEVVLAQLPAGIAETVRGFLAEPVRTGGSPEGGAP